MMRRLAVVSLLAAAACVASGQARAEDTGTVAEYEALKKLGDSLKAGDVIREAEGDGPQASISPVTRYLVNAEHRLFRGAANIATFPADLIVCPADTAMSFARRPRLMTAVQVPFSAGLGASKSVLRLVSGAMDVVTFLLPDFEPVAPPASYHCRPVGAY